jgi:hypothetical protein
MRYYLFTRDATILLYILQQIYSLQNRLYTIIGVDRQGGDLMNENIDHRENRDHREKFEIKPVFSSFPMINPN